jgi:hypothetical protein
MPSPVVFCSHNTINHSIKFGTTGRQRVFTWFWGAEKT